MSCILEMRGIIKYFSGNKVLEHVDFDLYRGEVHALVGENGAGKSTLMKLLAGVYTLDDGQILLDGQRVFIGNPKQAHDLGISMIHQETNLFPDLTVAENIFMRREPIKNIKWPRFI
ncbi:MAG: ATP-binding cassette domain-containing protein, partial [Mahellales bacterium]